MTDEYQLVSFKAPASLLRRVDTYVQRIQDGLGNHITITRSQAFRALLDIGLDNTGVPPEKRRTKRKRAAK